jgi:Na+/phosphate symporter
MMTMLIPLAFAIVGALIYALSANPKLQELGRLLFAAGVFALAFSLASYKFSL